MTTLYLHIGISKTGTSFLQNFLFHNREKLLEKGYLYPISGTRLSCQNILTRYAHTQLVVALFKQLNHRGNLVDNLDIWETLKNEIKTAQPQNVIISTENFTAYPKCHNPDVIAQLKKCLEEYETKIVVYLRRQDDFLSSYYCQRMRNIGGGINAAEKTDINEFIREYKYQADYYSVLELWKNSFGIENIIVRAFEKEQMKKGSLLDDFFETLEFRYDVNEFRFIESINNSPSLKTIRTIALLEKNIQKLQFLNIFQKHEKLVCLFLKIKRLIKTFILSKRVSNFISPLPEFLISDKEIISNEAKVNLMTEFEESNRKVAKEYLGRENGILFYSKP